MTLILLLISIQPVFAETPTTQDNREVECMIVDETGVLSSSLLLEQDEIDSFLEQITGLSDQIESEDTYLGLLRTVTAFLDDSNDDSVLEQELFKTVGDLHLNLAGKRVFVLSYGHGVQINPLRRFQVNLLRPSYLFWLYPGSSHIIGKDRTIIIDPNPFHVTTYDGRQVGIMKRFIGLYIFIPNKDSRESTVFFAGYAYRVLGLDLSPSH